MLTSLIGIGVRLADNRMVTFFLSNKRFQPPCCNTDNSLKKIPKTGFQICKRLVFYRNCNVYDVYIIVYIITSLVFVLEVEYFCKRVIHDFA